MEPTTASNTSTTSTFTFRDLLVSPLPTPPSSPALSAQSDAGDDVPAAESSDIVAYILSKAPVHEWLGNSSCRPHIFSDFSLAGTGRARLEPETPSEPAQVIFSASPFSLGPLWSEPLPQLNWDQFMQEEVFGTPRASVPNEPVHVPMESFHEWRSPEDDGEGELRGLSPSWLTNALSNIQVGQTANQNGSSATEDHDHDSGTNEYQYQDSSVGDNNLLGGGDEVDIASVSSRSTDRRSPLDDAVSESGYVPDESGSDTESAWDSSDDEDIESYFEVIDYASAEVPYHPTADEIELPAKAVVVVKIEREVLTWLEEVFLHMEIPEIIVTPATPVLGASEEDLTDIPLISDESDYSDDGERE